MISFRIHASLGIFVSTWKNKVSDAELLTEYEGLLLDPDFEPGFHECCDVRQADFTRISSAGMQALVALVGRHMASFEGEFKTAVIAPKDLSFGFARVYEAYSHDSHENVQVFRDARQALDWLGAPQDLLS